MPVSFTNRCFSSFQVQYEQHAYSDKRLVAPFFRTTAPAGSSRSSRSIAAIRSENDARACGGVTAATVI